MKIFRLVLLFLLFYNVAWSQKEDTIDLPTLHPIRFGYVLKNDIERRGLNGCPSPGLTIYSNTLLNDSVFSLSEGIVIYVGNIDDEYMCVIKRNDGKSFAYSGLESAVIRKGDKIKKQQYLGEMTQAEDVKQLRLVIMNGTNEINKKDYWSVLLRK